ncbi:MAG: hypothetical protein WA614_09245 [Acidimicrobiales bacterium]
MRVKNRISIAIVFAALVPLGATAAQASTVPHSRATPRVAACAQWNVAGTWASAQSNDYHVTFHIVQHGTKISGTSVNPSGEAASLGYTTGTFTGTVKGDHFNLVTHWTRSTVTGVLNIGNYYGTVSAGRITGLGRNLTVGISHQTVTWLATGRARCVTS